MAHTNRAYGPKDIENSIIISKKELIAKKFPFQQVAIDTLFQNILAQENTILYGPGGYGKSQLVKNICNALDLNTVVIQCYRDMPIEALLGPIDMNKFTKESKYYVNFKESPFMIPGVLILEEFTDLDVEVASAIKDVLQEKGYRNKDEFIPYNTHAVIAIGNTSPVDIAGSDSLRALYYDRFISHIKIIWENHTVNEYITLFKTKKADITTQDEFLAHLCAEAKVSPRGAITALKMITDNPSNSLSVIKSIHHFNVLDIEHLITVFNESNTIDS